ncbi:MAG: hypothetical protein ACT4NL_06860 [Pseudomarimonas sp.]
MRTLTLLVFAGACSMPLPASAQAVISDREQVGSDRPEAWAMNFAISSTLMSAFGALPELRTGEWRAALELSEVPHLSRAQQQVGFGGEKAEDLNKLPAFGRVRAWIGLPAGWVAELGFTPPIRINGTKASDLIAVAVGKKLVDADTWSLSARVVGQHGRVDGDITCPAELAGPFDATANPFGCVAPSSDRISLNYYGLDLTAATQGDPWAWHVTAGMLRSEPEVQVDALVFTVRDRSRVLSRSVLPYLAVGTQRSLNAHWSIGAEWLYVPLVVRRSSSGGIEDDPYLGLRVQLRYGWK